MAGHHDAVGAHHSADDQYLETPPGAQYEHTDANVRVVVKFGIWLVVSAIVIHIGLGFMFSLLKEQANQSQPNEYPLAAKAEPRLPAEPRLQQFPRNEIYEFRMGEEQELHSYGWQNKDAGTVHIPIERAMQLVVQRGLPVAQPPAGGEEDTPGLMPSDSSSGRVMERRRQ